MPLIRLDKFICDQGLGGRKEVRQIIKAGRVRLNGVTASAPDMKFDPESALVELDGSVLGYVKFRYYMMDKPTGVLTATRDGRQKTVLDLVTPEMRRMGLFPVGRLDKDTSGLLLLTNDGNFAHRVISPKSEVEKLYYAKVNGSPDASDCLAFEKGIVLADGTQCLPAKLELLGGDECYVRVMEGKYHQVKRMVASQGMKVLALKRLSMGPLKLDENLAPAAYRELTAEELAKLKRSAL